MSSALLLAGAIAFIQFFSQQFSRMCRPFYSQILSFSAGVSISYLFLKLFPEFVSSADSKLFFVSILAGFALWHLVEKYIYKTASRYKAMKQLALEDSVISFIYHFILGIVLVDMVATGQKEALLFFIPVALYTALSTLPVDPSRNFLINIFLASATLLGVLAASFFLIGFTLFQLLLGFVIGTMIFTIIRHSLPSGRAGEPFYFILGVLLYSILILFI